MYRDMRGKVYVHESRAALFDYPDNTYKRLQKGCIKNKRGDVIGPVCHKTLKRKIKKRSLDQIKEAILAIIEQAKKDYPDESLYLTKEDVAIHLQVKESQVEQVFMILNREGILTQPVHRAPHDSQRDPWGFDGISEWQSDHYYIRRKEEEEDV